MVMTKDLGVVDTYEPTVLIPHLIFFVVQQLNLGYSKKLEL